MLLPAAPQRPESQKNCGWEEGSDALARYGQCGGKLWKGTTGCQAGFWTSEPISADMLPHRMGMTSERAGILCYCQHPGMLYHCSRYVCGSTGVLQSASVI